MSKIKFKQINENEVSVTLDNNVPLDMVEQLTKSLQAKGMIENKSVSSVTTRYFYKSNPTSVADELIKSLQSLTKGIDPGDLSNPYSKASQAANREKNRINDRRAQTNSAPLTETQIAQAKAAPKAPAVPKPPTVPNTTESSGPRTLTGGPNKLLGEVGYGGQLTTKKSEDEECECSQEDCEKCMAKSNYGPKGAKQYTVADNIRRKANNTGDQTGFGNNVNTKQYTTAKYGNTTPQTDPKLKRPQPVKVYSDEEKAALASKMNLKKSWGQHLPFPSAEEEIMRLASMEKAAKGEDAMANQLAQMMRSKSMLSNHNQPSAQEFEAAGEAMGLGVTEEMAKNAENQWNGTFNNWLKEASKPISQRFNSEEEELAYWANIKVQDSGGDSGY